MMTRARGERRGAKMMALIVASLATLVRGDEYSVNIERAIVNSKGLQAVGALDALSARLLEALCESDETSCEAYETTRKSLWLTFGNDYICQVGSDADATWNAIDTTSTQGGIAVLLSKCSRAWLGDLEQAVLNLAPRFLAQASLQRADVAAVIAANDAAAARAMGRRRGTTTKDDGAIATRDSRRGIRDGGTRGDAGGRQLRRPASELHSKLGSDRDRVNVVQ